MKTYQIVLVVISLIIGVCALVLWNAFKIKREFVVLYQPNLNFCFLVDDRYELDIDKNSVKYSGGKNSGHLQFLRSSLTKNYQKVEINGFYGSYAKMKNKRIYEYEINDTFIVRDEYENVEKSIVNLVPYRDDCIKIMHKFKNHKKIFEEVPK